MMIDIRIMSPRQPTRRASTSGNIIWVILVVIATVLLRSSSSSAISVPGGSIRAELFHREHPFSSSWLQTSKPVGHLERIHSEGKRSAARAQAVVQRKLTGEFNNVSFERSATWESTLTNEAPAEYLMTISVGTPPQQFVAVADTGSDLTWLQCAPCENCFNQSSPVFDPSLSSTYQNLSCSSEACKSFLLQYGPPFVTACQPSCEYAYFYGDNSNTSGTFSAETITLMSTSGHDIKVPDFWFGCSQASFSQSALFDSANGLVGLGQGLISFPSQLGDVFDDKFSYCLVNRSLAAVQSSSLLFGRDAALDIPLHYTPFLANPTYPYYYYIGVEGITVDGGAVNYSTSALTLDCFGNGGTIIDSGSTFSYLDPRAFSPLLAAIEAKVPQSYEKVILPIELSFLELCYDVTGQPDYASVLPDITFKLANDTNWQLSLDNSWILLQDIPSAGSFVVCLAMMRGYEGAISIFGNTQQQDFHVLYDRVDQRLGFAPTDCSAT